MPLPFGSRLVRIRRRPEPLSAVPDLRHLPFDNTYARLGAPFGRRVEPTPLLRPHAVAWNPDAAALLDIDPAGADGEF
jgi:hypothetical protein